MPPKCHDSYWARASDLERGRRALGMPESARGYLAMGNGFSRKGLIGQLSSKYGDGFPRKTAVFAVNHVSVNWRHQAVLSAKGYLGLGEGFSCASLTEQLDSPYGEQFTPAQAQYAAKAVGLCP